MEEVQDGSAGFLAVLAVARIDPRYADPDVHDRGRHRRAALSKHADGYAAAIRSANRPRYAAVWYEPADGGD